MLLKPVITEKSMRLAQAGQFTFAITPSTSKGQVKTEVEKLFKVEVVRVRTVRIKAIVTLKPGQTIEYFELPKKEKKKKSTK